MDKVLFTNCETDGYICFKTFDEYIAFLKDNDKVISEVKSEIDGISEDAAYSLYLFMNFHKETKKNKYTYISQSNYFTLFNKQFHTKKPVNISQDYNL